MGAHSFSTTTYGKDALDAFRSATSEARHQHGNDAYNGTISTVHSFRVIDKPKRLTPAQFQNLVWHFEAERPAPTKPAVRRAFTDKWDRIRHEQAKELFKTWASLTPAEQDLVRAAGRTIEKWECCVAYELTGKAGLDFRKRHAHHVIRNGQTTMRIPRGRVFTFFGLAAS